VLCFSDTRAGAQTPSFTRAQSLGDSAALCWGKPKVEVWYRCLATAQPPAALPCSHFLLVARKQGSFNVCFVVLFPVYRYAAVIAAWW